MASDELTSSTDIPATDKEVSEPVIVVAHNDFRILKIAAGMEHTLLRCAVDKFEDKFDERFRFFVAQAAIRELVAAVEE